MILWMYYVLAHKPGGQPIGALERVFARITKAIGKLVRRRDRRVPAAAAS
jgi:lipopolysaccharide export system permease protein